MTNPRYLLSSVREHDTDMVVGSKFKCSSRSVPLTAIAGFHHGAASFFPVDRGSDLEPLVNRRAPVTFLLNEPKAPERLSEIPEFVLEMKEN